MGGKRGGPTAYARDVQTLTPHAVLEPRWQGHAGPSFGIVKLRPNTYNVSAREAQHLFPSERSSKLHATLPSALTEK
eukprot:2969020-Amphidinium_carterae.1